MYRPRRVGRGTTPFPSDASSALFVCAWCAGYSALWHDDPTVSDRRPEQPSTAGRIGTVFGLQQLQLKTTILIRFAGMRVRARGAFVRLHTARFGGHAIYKVATHRHLRVRVVLVVDGMVGPRRVRIASGLRDPLRHVVVTALDLLPQVVQIGTDTWPTLRPTSARRVVPTWQ